MSKEKLSTKQFLLIINGPSCGGKTTTADILLERYGGIFNAQSDRIKWLISDYDSGTHRGIVHQMTLATIEVALKNNLSVLKQGALYEPENIIQIAKDLDIPFFIANISAPKEVLDKRFLGRIDAKKNGVKVANVDPVRFQELYDMYLATKMETSLEFDSSIKTPEDIATLIGKHIQDELSKYTSLW